jgi:single-stranded-DNA-specific exonuclease
MKDRLPDAVVVHPRRPDGSYPFGGLSGSGVALKLAWAFCQRVCGGEKVTPRYRDFLLDAVVLAALGLVADSVPLRDENRILVRHGLARLRAAPTLGLKALLEVSGLAEKNPLLAEDVSFKLAPRINAAGRLGCARLVVDLFTTPSAHRAKDLARFLDDQNTKRQQLERRILGEARDQAEAFDPANSPALVLASPNWHAGVIGIVAGRLAERYGRPVLMIAVAAGRNGVVGAIGQGSGRSIPGFQLHEALRACGDHLIGHGGHAAAAGFTVQPDRIDAFRDAFVDYAGRHFPDGPPTPGLVIDAEVPLSALTMGLVNDLARLEPYGMENLKPLFLAGGLKLEGEPKLMGAGETHMSFRVRQNGAPLRAVAFGMADRRDELVSAGGQCNLVFTPKINDWQGQRSVELEVKDFQAGPRARLT